LQALGANILAPGVVRGEVAGSDGTIDHHPVHGSAPCLGLPANEVASKAAGSIRESQHKEGGILGVLVVDGVVPLIGRRANHRVAHIANGQDQSVCTIPSGEDKVRRLSAASNLSSIESNVSIIGALRGAPPGNGPVANDPVGAIVVEGNAHRKAEVLKPVVGGGPLGGRLSATNSPDEVGVNGGQGLGSHSRSIVDEASCRAVCEPHDVSSVGQVVNTQDLRGIDWQWHRWVDGRGVGNHAVRRNGDGI